MKLTTMVRKSSSSNPRYQNDSPAAEGEEAMFELYCPILVRRAFPNARTSLTKQLSDTIIQRRRRLTRQRRRQDEQRSPEVTQQTREMDPVLHHEETQSHATAMPEIERHQPQSPYSSKISKPGLSFIHRLRNTGQRAESIIGTSRSALDPALYPPLPQPESSDSEFAHCPYCFEPLALPLLDEVWR